ncbi:MAG: hypothetical protein Kow00121_30010 [Elainellaceae cyanobacterium]
MVTRQNAMNASDRLTAAAHLEVNNSPLSASASKRLSAKSLLVYTEAEPNNTLTDAYARNNMRDVTGTTKRYSGQVSSTDQTDIYAFNVSKSLNTVNLNLSGSTGNLTLGLYDSRGYNIGVSINPGSNESITKAGLAAGTYYAKVIKSDSYTSANNYSLSVSGRESQRQVKVTITNLNDTDGDLDQDYRTPFGANIIREADFNAQIRVGNVSRSFSGASDRDNISPNWQVSNTFAASERGIPITISASDRDPGFDEKVDLHPSTSIDGGLSIQYNVDRQKLTVFGVGREYSLGESITLAGSGNNHDARVTFKVESVLV